MIAAAPRALGLLLVASLVTVPAVAREEEEGLPILESGTAAVDLGTRRLTVRYSTTIAGPLVEVQPLIAELGGELEIGPLGESHELRLNERTFAFGPGSDALTWGTEIVDLSQAAIAGETGAQVPLDLLDHIYGHQLGYEFSWNPTARLLTIRHQPARELDMQFNLVHVQGVTTVVFQFSTRPRYRIRETPTSVAVSLIGDRIAGGTARTLPRDDLVRGMSMSAAGIRLQLAPGASVESYVLDEPYRLVFDVFRDGRQAAAQAPSTRPERRRARLPGIRTVVLDPGHGGADTGAVGVDGIEEKRLTLQVALTTKRLLEERLPVRVVLTRNADIGVTLESRAALANQNKGDLFVSLHFNSARGAGARGPETFLLSPDGSRASTPGGGGDPLFDLELEPWDLAQNRHLAGSRTLGTLIQQELNDRLDSRRGVRQAPLRVLMGVAMPAVLVELGFLTHPEEAERLQDPLYRFELADALSRAIGRYRARVEGLPEEPREPAR